MTEMLGLASMAEVPCVIVDVQRGGPSTGLPTKSEQSDLWQAVFGSHGDAPRVVIGPFRRRGLLPHAPSTPSTSPRSIRSRSSSSPTSRSASGARPSTRVASSTRSSTARLPTADELVRLQAVQGHPDGISPMSVPGMKDGIYQTNGLEHDESGRPASMHLVHEKMNAKRYRKLRPIREKYQRSTAVTAPRRPTSASSAGARRRAPSRRPSSCARRARPEGRRVRPADDLPVPEEGTRGVPEEREAGPRRSRSPSRRSSTSTCGHSRRSRRAPSSSSDPAART